MAKVTFQAGAVIYKKALGKAADINVGEITKAIATDAGAMVVVTPLAKFVKGVQTKDIPKPVLHLGVHGGNLVLTVQGSDGTHENEIIVKGYEKMKADKAKATVINAQKGDKVIDSSSDRMAKAKGTTSQDYDDADVSDVKGDIVILAHGANVGKSPGAVYAKEFGDKKPADIVNYLVKTKKLPKAYAGVVYLDGCYTAAGPKGNGAELNNFCKKVYDGLKAAGYKYLQVKGNLGVASTLDDGKESVVDAQMEKEIEVATKKIQKEIEKFKKQNEELGKKLGSALEDKKKLLAEKKKIETDATLDENKRKKKVEEVDAKLVKVQSSFDKVSEEKKGVEKLWSEQFKIKQKIIEDLKKKGISADKIEDLVGTFGPEMSPPSG